ncbi:MAG: riboflavin synthase [Terriglobia bacterium]
MFSGIVEVTSSIVRVQDGHGQQILSIRKPVGWKLGLGESVCVDGVCSTVQKVDRGSFQVCYMPETLRLTTLINARRMGRVNLERSLTLDGLIGGHLVQGHVDTTARIGSVKNEGEAKLYEFKIPRRFSRYIADKGSIAVDGISLTVVKSLPGRFTVSLLDYTLTRTTLGNKRPGDRVNIEVDVLAKYVEKLLRS